MTPLGATCRSIFAVRLALAFLVGLAAMALPAVAPAQIPLFFEDFDGVPLSPPVDEPLPFPNAFSHDPPPGWEFDDSGVPGVGDPFLGVTEWEGWSFANSEFWRATAQLDTGPTPRNLFHRGQGVIAVADPDQWNDLGNPANSPEGGFYNTLIETPLIDVAVAEPPEIRLKLGFDSSWFGGGCCDDGQEFGPGQPPPFSNNQTAVVNLKLSDGTEFEVLRWEAAPFLDQAGNPRNQPGPGTIPNPFFKAPDVNERVWLDLEPDQATALGLALGGVGSLGGSGGADGAAVEFGMENAGDDGWWGIDNIEMLAVSTVLGDMNVNDVLDAGDVGAFALGLLDTKAYRQTYYGEFPVTRGSDDGTFDFDDIEWFVDILEMGGVQTSVGEVMALLSVPEPSGTLLLLTFGITHVAFIRRRK